MFRLNWCGEMLEFAFVVTTENVALMSFQVLER